MKSKILLLLLMALCLGGCGGKEEDIDTEKLSLTAKEKEVYKTEIDNTLRSFYWKYDDNSILYFNEAVPSKEEGESNGVFTASKESGFELEKYASKLSIVATVNLVHFNGDAAGLAYFHFIKNKPVGVYYTAKNNPKSPFSLKSRNVFFSDTKFKAYESQTPMTEFSEKKSRFPESGFSSMGKNSKGETLLTVIDGDNLLIYRYRNGFSIFKRVTFESELVPISATFYSNEDTEADEVAVLLGSYVPNDTGIGFYISEKVVFLDSNMAKIQEEIVLDSTSYTCVSSDEGKLILMKEKTIEYFEKDVEGWTKQKQARLNHNVTCFKESDIDSDGISEYLMTDGMDFYMYRKNATGFTNVWRTHLSIESLTGYIYVGDLNQDGIKEIYVCDTTGTSIRYILSENGLVSQNEDIEYGQRFFAGDFDGDGKDDFIKIKDIENSAQSLYMSK